MALGRLVIDVHVHPGSRRAAVGGRHGDALVVRVRSRAVEGAANDEVLDSISRAFALPRRAVDFAHPTRSRDKRVCFVGDVATLRGRLERLLSGVD